MNLVDAIFARRSVRSYTSRRVDDETIHALLRAAVQAPSAMNAQSCVFAVVQNAAQLARWSERAKQLFLRRTPSRRYAELLHDPSFNVFYDASTLIVIGVKERGPFSDADGWLAAENLMLAACDAGLGTCCIGFALPLLDTPEVKAEIALPEEGHVVAAIIVGYPASVPPPTPRYAPRIVSWSR